MIVLDASALVDILIGWPSGARAALRGERVAHVPELADPEILNALKREARRGAVGAARAERALRALGDLPLVRHRHGPLRGRAWSLRERCSAYDAFYVALAEVLGAVLVTADARLARAAADLVEVNLAAGRP